MTNIDTSNLRKEHFAHNWLAWASMRHFLSASLLRELTYAIVDQISHGSLSLDQILEEAEPAGQGSFASWIIRPISNDSSLAIYLQRRIQNFSWQSDSEVHIMEDSISPNDVDGPATLEKFIALGAADFGFSDKQIGTIESKNQISAAKFIEAFCFAQNSHNSLNAAKYCSQLSALLVSIEMPLSSVILKHFGDLCADVDDWDKAHALYIESSNKLIECNHLQWQDFKSAFQAIITQSQAAALRNIEGSDSASQHFRRAFDGVTVREAPLLLANASWDANVALIYSEEGAQFKEIPRATLLPPPLLLNSQSDSGALVFSLEQDFPSAHRRFWSVLRRQIALGSATESRVTKAHYAESILDELSLIIARHDQPDSFRMAIRLLIESGLSKSAKKIDWNERIVDAYVNQECVDFAIAHANSQVGSQRERNIVVMTIFRRWSELISPDHSEVSANMLRYIASLALENNSSLFEAFNVGGRCLEALEEIAEKRPELRRVVESEVALAAATKIRSQGFWKGRAAGLETAIAFLDVMSDSSLKEVIDSTIGMMRELGSETQIWPLMRPALQLLIADPVMLFSRRQSGLESTIVSTILEFGLRQESEQATILVCLKDFDSEIVRKASVQSELQEAVKRVKQNAIQINASNSIYNIDALLYASAASGRDGVESALKALKAIFQSVEDTKHPSMNLAHAYTSLILLANRQNEIAKDISVDIAVFRLWLEPLMPLICSIWNKAKSQPLIFSTFSIPAAEKPDSIVVHNWAFASMLFAASIGQETVLKPFIAEAATKPALANGIALARVTRSVAQNLDDIDFDGIRLENRDVFYAALGRRLSILQKYDIENARDYCKALIDQCFRLGPRDIDAAVFLVGFRLDLANHVGKIDASDYKKRLRNIPDIRQNLEPILGLFGDSSMN